MKSFFAAISFLSILPIPDGWTGDHESLGKSVRFFPIAGLIMGGIMAFFCWALAPLIPQLALAAMVTVGLLVMTRGFHMDGLGDVADGFWSNGDRTRILEIMKDSRVGAMGAMAIVGAILLKFSFLAGSDRDLLWKSVLLMVTVGRCAMIVPLSLFPYARKEGGLGSLFFENRNIGNLAWALLIVVIAGWLLFGLAGIAVGLAGMGVALLFGFYCKHKIGGATGDTIGATCEIVEIATLLAICLVEAM